MRLRDDYFGLWFPLGFLSGVSFTGLLVLAPTGQSFVNWANQYQTLIGAIIAVVAAFLTVLSTHRSTRAQINAANLAEESRRHERLRAARALLPFALTELVQYCESTGSDLKSVLYSHQQMDRPPSGSILFVSSATFEARPVPRDVLERIQSVIESAPNEIARELGALLTNIQIYTSRLKSLEEQTVRSLVVVKTTYQVTRAMINICELHARAGRCFEYGRFKSDRILDEPISQAEIHSSAVLLYLDAEDSVFERLVEESFPASPS